MNENQDNVTKLKEIILDDEKVVTYISVSKELCVHVNTSKFLLLEVVNEVKRKMPDVELNVTYIISGSTSNNKALTTVCSGDQLDIIRKTFIAVFFEHIYSVNKGKSSVHSATLLAANKFDDFSLSLGLIKSSHCVKRTTEDILNLTRNSEQLGIEQNVVPLTHNKLQVNTDIIKNNHGIDINEEKIKSVKTENKNSCNKDSINIKQKNGGQKMQKGIAGFFNKPSNISVLKNKETVNVKNHESVIKRENQEKLDVITKDKDINEEHINIIAKDKKAIKLEHINVIAKDKKAVKQEHINVIAKDKLAIKEEHMNVPYQHKTSTKYEPENELKKPTTSCNQSVNMSLKDLKKKAKLDKKRKRVLHISDSESENDDPFLMKPSIETESEDEIPPTPVATIKITSGIINPKKRRKLVDKAYTCEDGYLLTKKEEIYESCSESEETIIDENKKDNLKDIELKSKVSPKEKQNENKKTKISPPQKRKQAMLTNYFKKS